MKTGDANKPATRRGSTTHRTRVQLLEAADEHFRRYGYNKTTVADLARAIGVSPAYVYRFFESKQAIGEAVCTLTLARIMASLRAVEQEPRSAAERLRRMYRTLVAEGVALYFSERKLHDIVAAAIGENWAPIAVYKDDLAAMVRRLVSEGRDAGEFERKTPLDDACTAITSTLASFCHPTLLEQTEHSDLQANSEQVANLVLRSLAP